MFQFRNWEKEGKLKIVAIVFLTYLMTLAWSWGLTLATLYTVQSHAYILANIHGVFSLLIMMAMCKRTHHLEKIGTLIVIGGALLMVFDPKAVRKGEEVNPVASALTLITNIPGALLWIGMSYLLQHLDLTTVCFCQILITNMYLVIGSLIFEGATFTMDRKNGIFGFMLGEFVLISFLWNATLACFFAFCGYVIAMQYFSPLVIMNCLCLEPIASQTIGIIMEIDEVPGWMSWCGLALIIVALNVIQKGEFLKLNQIKDEQ